MNWRMLAISSCLTLTVAAHASAWTPGGVRICVGSNGDNSPSLESDGAGKAILAFSDVRSGGSPDIYVQSIDASGHPLWGEGGRRICAAASEQECPRVISDGHEGAFVTWYDERHGEGTYVIYAQRVGPTGAPLWMTDGLRVSVGPGKQWYPNLVPDGEGGTIIVWYDDRNGNEDIFAQRIDATGHRLWGESGVTICAAAGDQIYPKLVPDGLGGATIAWYDRRAGNDDIFAQRISFAGVVAWAADGVPLCAASGDQQIPSLIPDGSGGAIVTWQDYRGGVYADIYAQHVDGTGGNLWRTDGELVCGAAKSQKYPALTADGAGGAIITWYDVRNGNGNNDIFAQRISSTGQAQWTPNGVALCTAAGTQDHPVIEGDGSGGATVAWFDKRSGEYDVYAQLIDPAGMPKWEANGRVVCDAPGDQTQVRITTDAANGSIVSWFDGRMGAEREIYAQRLSGSGTVAVETLSPSAFALSAPRPSPARERTMLSVEMHMKGPLDLWVSDLAGRRVYSIAGYDRLEAGRHEFAWDLDDESGRPVRAGVYFLVARSADEYRTTRVAIVR